MAKKPKRKKRVKRTPTTRVKRVRKKSHVRSSKRAPSARLRAISKGRDAGAKRAQSREADTRVARTRLRRIRWRMLPGLDTISDHSGDTNGRPLQGRTIEDQLLRLETIAPFRTVDGHLYRTQEQLHAKTKRATMFLLIQSSDNTFAVHETLYVSRKRKRSPVEWFRWFSRHAFKGTDPDGTPTERDGIIRGNILPGVNTRTGKIWEVVGGPNRITKSTRGYLGYITHDLRKPIPAKVARKRNKTKPQRRAHGKNNRRRGHRNRRRKT